MNAMFWVFLGLLAAFGCFIFGMLIYDFAMFLRTGVSMFTPEVHLLRMRQSLAEAEAQIAKANRLIAEEKQKQVKP